MPMDPVIFLTLVFHLSQALASSLVALVNRPRSSRAYLLACVLRRRLSVFLSVVSVMRTMASRAWFTVRV